MNTPLIKRPFFYVGATGMVPVIASNSPTQAQRQRPERTLGACARGADCQAKSSSERASPI
jgi:hypothetical protein